MKIVSTFDLTHEQTCVCLLNGTQLKSFDLVRGSNTVSVEVTNLQESNNLRYYFLNNNDIVELNNFSIDGLDFRMSTQALYTHHFTQAVQIDQDGSRHMDTTYNGHTLNNSGYFKIIFDLPIENWFFKTWGMNNE
jgi:hypothetical protein